MMKSRNSPTSCSLLVTSCSSSNSSILLTGDAREGEEARLLDSRSVDGGVSGRVSAWVSDGAEGTGVALVVTDAVMTGRIGLTETICIQCSLLAVGDSGLRSISVMM